MFQYKTKGKGIEALKALALETGNGIYIIYADHLSCDAITVFTVEDGSIIDETELIPGYGHGCLAYQFQENYLPKHSLLPVYGFTAAWFTFPMEWRNNQTFIKEYVYEPATLIVTPVEKQ